MWYLDMFQKRAGWDGPFLRVEMGNLAAMPGHLQAFSETFFLFLCFLCFLYIRCFLDHNDRQSIYCRSQSSRRRCSRHTKQTCIRYRTQNYGREISQVRSQVLINDAGKNWKLRKTATGRAQKAKYLRRSWEQRTEERKKKEAVKALEKQMKDEIQAEKDVRNISCQIRIQCSVLILGFYRGDGRLQWSVGRSRKRKKEWKCSLPR